MKARKKKIQNANLLERKLGYSFSDSDLLHQALSHRSIGRFNNERLEFLGDSLINFFMAEAMYQKFSNQKEGDLSRLRSHLVKGETLAEIAISLDLGDYLQLGEGELKSGGFRRKSILADAVEAIIGAIYLDSDIETCKACVQQWFSVHLNKITVDYVDKDPKTRLQEYQQSRARPLPEYSVVEQGGQSHSRRYVVQCSIGEFAKPCEAEASSKREAEKLSAQIMLVQLGLISND